MISYIKPSKNTADIMAKHSVGPSLARHRNSIEFHLESTPNLPRWGGSHGLNHGLGAGEDGIAFTEALGG